MGTANTNSKEIEQHRCCDPTRLTFAELSRRWLEDVKADIQPVTVDFYAGNLRRHLVPVLGPMVASEVHPSDLKALYAAKREPHPVLDETGRPVLDSNGEAKLQVMSEKSIKHMHATVRACYSWAVEVELLDRNPAMLISGRRRKGRRQIERPEDRRGHVAKTWDPDEIAHAVVLARGQLVCVPLMLAGRCGLRRGEVCGLRWDDVDLGAAILRVSASQEQIGRELFLAPPKSQAGYRTLDMPEALVAELRGLRLVHDGLRLRSAAWNPDGYVLVPRRGTPIKPANLSSAWASFCRRKGLDHLRFHDLRHSYVTDMRLRQNQPEETVAALAGHSDPATTKSIYSHPDDKMRRDVGARQKARVAAAMAKAVRDSGRVRDVVAPLPRSIG